MPLWLKTATAVNERPTQHRGCHQRNEMFAHVSEAQVRSAPIITADDKQAQRQRRELDHANRDLESAAPRTDLARACRHERVVNGVMAADGSQQGVESYPDDGVQHHERETDRAPVAQPFDRTCFPVRSTGRVVEGSASFGEKHFERSRRRQSIGFRCDQPIWFHQDFQRGLARVYFNLTRQREQSSFKRFPGKIQALSKSDANLRKKEFASGHLSPHWRTTRKKGRLMVSRPLL